MSETSAAPEEGEAQSHEHVDCAGLVQWFPLGTSVYYEHIDEYLKLCSFLDIPEGAGTPGNESHNNCVTYLKDYVQPSEPKDAAGGSDSQQQSDEADGESAEAADIRAKRMAYFSLQHHYRAGLNTDEMRRLTEQCVGQPWFQMQEKLVADDFLLIEPHLWYFLDSQQARKTVELKVPNMLWLNDPAKVAKKVGDYVKDHPFPPLLHLYSLTIADLWAAYSADEWTLALSNLGLSGSQQWSANLSKLGEEGSQFPKWDGDAPAPLVQALINVKLAIANWTVTNRSGKRVWWSKAPRAKDAPIHPRYHATEARIRSLLGEAIGREPYNDERTAREQFRKAGVAIDRAIAGQRVSDSRGALLIAEFRGIRGEVQLRRTAFDIELRARRMIREAAERSQAEAQTAVEDAKMEFQIAVENSKKEFIQLLGLLGAILAFLLVSVNIATKWSTVEQAIALIGGAGLFLVFGSFSWSLFVMQPKLDRAWFIKVLIGGLGLAVGAGIVALLLNATPQGNVPTERPTPSASAVAQP